MFAKDVKRSLVDLPDHGRPALGRKAPSANADGTSYPIVVLLEEERNAIRRRQRAQKAVFGPAAVRDTEGLEAAEAIPLIKEIQAYFETRPIPVGQPRIKKLAGFGPPLYRLRIGDFRAYYRISGDEAVIRRVTRRKDSDKRLKRISEEDEARYGR